MAVTACYTACAPGGFGFDIIGVRTVAIYTARLAGIDAARDVCEVDVDQCIGLVTCLCACIGIGSVAFST